MIKFNTYHPITDADILGTPIEYNQLNKEDFKGLETRKDIIDIGVDGYLSETAWEDYINLDEHNTVVVNSSVGQGKSFLARQIATKYYMARDEDEVPLYTVIFAVPYKSLIEQYINDTKEDLLQEGIEDIVIPDYNKLVEWDEKREEYIEFEERIEEASSKRLHVITINCLLGNPGDNAIEQSRDKQAYLNSIIVKCRDEGRKIILIYDEIHDAIDNFKQELIFNLWKFRTNFVLHKAFILSATFNEASKVVIKYIAELTSKNLQIIETKRIQSIKKLSRLHIHLTNEDYYNLEKDEFKELFREIIKKHDTLNILSYSRRLCKELADGTNSSYIRDLLFKRYGRRINICVQKDYIPSNWEKRKKGIPDWISYNEKYQKGMCNIGTTFRTGISINEENSGLVIILPSGKSMQGFWTKEKYGIFSKGVISLIQALARVREKSDIYVIMPFPHKYIQTAIGEPYFLSDNYMLRLVNINIFKYRVITHRDHFYKHHSEFDKLIRSKYKSLKRLVNKEIKMVKKFDEAGMRNYLPDLNYPTLERFTLEKGELYLYSKYAIYGKDLPAYMVWAAFHNQFVNCKLVEVSSSKSTEEIKIDNIQEFLFWYFILSKRISPHIIDICDIELYNYIFTEITSNYSISIKNKDNKEEEVSHSKLKKHIMSFIQKFFKGNKELRNKYIQVTEHDENNIELTDDEFSKEDYLLCAMSNSLIYNLDTDKLTDNAENNDLIKAYQDLYTKIQPLFMDRFILPYDGEIGYIYPTLKGYDDNLLNEEDKHLIIQVFEAINNDANYRVFNKNGIKLKDKDAALGTIYNILKDMFFITKEYREPEGDRKRILILRGIKHLHNNRTLINLLYKYPYNAMESFGYDNEEDYMRDLGDWHEINQSKQEDVERMTILKVTKQDFHINNKPEESDKENKDDTPDTFYNEIVEDMYIEQEPTQIDIQRMEDLRKLLEEKKRENENGDNTESE